jgi:response regulator RpfG family c-di-GMP phosphodiesterase
MDQALISNEKNVYAGMCKLNLHTDLMDFLKILNIHKNILYTNVARIETNIGRLGTSISECNMITENIFKVIDRRMFQLSEKNNHELLIIKKSLESFGFNIDSLIEDIVKNKIKDLTTQNEKVIKDLTTQNEKVIKQITQETGEFIKKVKDENENFIKEIAERNEKLVKEIAEGKVIVKKSIKKQYFIYIVIIFGFIIYETTSDKYRFFCH